MSDKTDVSKLTFVQLALLLNSCGYGAIADSREIKEMCMQAGLKVTDGKTVHLMKFIGLLAEKRHKHAERLPKKEPPKYEAKKALPDRRKVDNLTWREAIKKQPFFDDAKKGVFLQHYAMTGRKSHSALMAGVSVKTVERGIKDDPDFKDAVAEMKEYYKDHVHEIATDQFTGVSEPIMGGKGKDKIVGWKAHFPNNALLAMELKRTNPEYNEKHEVDMNVSGGVLVAPATMSMDEYIKKNVKTVSDGIDSIDVEATEKE